MDGIPLHLFYRHHHNLPVMAYLLDTHTLVWWWLADPKLSDAARAIVSDPSQQVMVSAATAYEIANKVLLGKWPAVRSIAVEAGIAPPPALFEAVPVAAEPAPAEEPAEAPPVLDPRYRFETFLTQELPPLIDAEFEGNGRDGVAGLARRASPAPRSGCASAARARSSCRACPAAATRSGCSPARCRT